LHTVKNAGGKTEKFMVHQDCHKKLHSGKSDFEPVLLIEDFAEA
jgi:hypothetical protein